MIPPARWSGLLVAPPLTDMELTAVAKLRVEWGVLPFLVVTRGRTLYHPRH